MEACIVLPLVILTVVSVMTLTLYYYNRLSDQVDTQYNAICETRNRRAIFKLIKQKNYSWGKMQGTVRRTFSREYEAHCYVINVTEGVRLGRSISFKDE